jgi:hypothetical protein
MSRGSSVAIATGYGMDGGGSTPGRGKTFFSFAQRPDQLWGPPSPWIPEDLFPGVKRPGREADNSPPSSTELNNNGAMLPLPHTSSRRGA